MRWFCFTFLGLLLVSCASAPDRAELSSSVPVPEQWVSPVSNDSIRTNWWQKFGDTNLTALIEEALRNNHDLKIAAARIEAAEAVAQIAGADAYPKADLAFNSARRQQNFVGLPIPGAGNRVLTSRSTTHGVALNLSWELDFWGRVRAGREAALADFQVATNEYLSAQQSIAAQTAKIWLAVTETEHQLALARNTASNFTLTAQQVRSRYEKGIRPPLDLRLALSSESIAKGFVSQREREVQSTRRQLEILLGRYPTAEQPGSSGLPELAGEIPAGLPSELLERRPDLVAAERRLAAADVRVREAKAALFPRFALTTSGGRSSSELEDLLSNQFNVWALAANVAQPLFEGGRLRGNIKQAKARAREASENYAATALRAFAEVENALASDEWLARQETDLAEAAIQSTAALRLAEQRYNAGLESFVTVLEAQRRAFESESQHLAVRRQRLDNRVDLHLALGGSFDGSALTNSTATGLDQAQK